MSICQTLHHGYVSALILLLLSFFILVPSSVDAYFGGSFGNCGTAVAINPNGTSTSNYFYCPFFTGTEPYREIARLYLAEQPVLHGDTVVIDDLPTTVPFRLELVHATDTIPMIDAFSATELNLHDPENNQYIIDVTKGHMSMRREEEVRFYEPGTYTFLASVGRDYRDPYIDLYGNSVYHLTFDVVDTSTATDTDQDEPADEDEDEEEKEDETDDEDEQKEESEEEDEEETEEAGDKEDDNKDEPTGASNVLFLPGIMGSRLYEESDACARSVEEQQRWFSTNDCDQMRLTTDFIGRSSNSIYTIPDQSGIVDRAFVFLRLYRSFLGDLADWKDAGTIADYRAMPYDWRLRLDDIIQTVYEDGRIQYRSTAGYQDSYLYQTLEELVESSHSGNVTIVTHSNGGLLAKVFLYALEQNEDPLLERVDNLVLVGVPQVGTPSSLVGMLHGDSIGPWGWVVSQERSRVLLNNMPFGYHLLPQAQYFDDVNITVETPVVQFANGTATAAWREQFGAAISDQEQLRGFIHSGSGRTPPADDDLSLPAVLEDHMVGYVNTIQTILRNWQTTESMRVQQIAGTGLWTPSGLTYFNKKVCERRQLLIPWRCAEYGDEIGYRVNHVRDGDETVVAPSAVAMAESERVRRWWIDLDRYNELNPSRVHKDLFEFPEVSTFVKDIVQATTTQYEYIQSAKPDLDDDIRLVFQLHSPLDMYVIDGVGSRLGSSTEEIAGGMYRRYGELQYISVPKTDGLEVVLRGQSSGSFTLEVEEWLGAELVDQTAFAAIPSGTSTVVRVDVADSLPDIVLEMDYAGDGVVDVQYSPEGEVTDIPEPGVDEVVEADTEVVETASPQQVSRGNDVTQRAVTMRSGEVAGVVVSGIDAENQVYYEMIMELLKELKGLLDLMGTRL